MVIAKEWRHDQLVEPSPNGGLPRKSEHLLRRGIELDHQASLVHGDQRISIRSRGARFRPGVEGSHPFVLATRHLLRDSLFP